MIKKRTNNLSDCDFYSGETVLLDKPLNWTSFDVVSKIRNAVGVKKVGHTGTLDPMATGLLIICTGKKTKEISSFQDLEKTYTGSILLGKRSRSMDLETELIGNEDLSSIKDEDIYDARDKFMGNILQVPPMFSAIKFKGKSLYNIARKGKTIELKPREVNVSKFEILEINKPYVKFEITCSKGTYIRSIANDLGEELGCGGVLSSLRRTAIGNFFVNDALSIDEFVFLSKAMKAQREKEVSECIQ
ncbi:MAG TPA: tRNA pseudouridine(55) synthase TruB [Ignavibacteriaceae bacterium]